MSTTLEELKEMKVELGLLEHSLQVLIEAAELDGVIDAEEQAAIAEMKACIRDAKARRDALEAELAPAREEAPADKPAEPPDADPSGTSAAYADYVASLGESSTAAEVTPPGAPDCGPAHHDSAPAFEPDGPFYPEPALAGPAAEDDPGLLQELIEQQVEQQLALLDATPAEAEAILADMEATSAEVAAEAERLAPETAQDADGPPEPLAEELLETHRDLYQAFLNARDPDYPDVLSASQEAILEDMRAISEELAIEAERSVMIQENPRLYGLEGEALEDEHQLALHEESGAFYGDGVSDHAIETGEPDGPAASDYYEMFTQGEGGEEKTLGQIMSDLEASHERLLEAQALGPAHVEERKRQIIRLFARYDIHGDVTRTIREAVSGGKLVGFQFSVGEAVVYDGVPDDRRGLPHAFVVGLDGTVIKCVETNDTFTTVPGALIDAAAKDIAERTGLPEIAVAVPLEVLLATLGQPVEMALDAADLIGATAKWVEDEDGSIFPVLVTAGFVVIPFSRAGKRVFKIGDEFVDAAAVAARAGKKRGDALPEGVGYMAGGQMDEAAALSGAGRESGTTLAEGAGSMTGSQIDEAAMLARAESGPSAETLRRYEELKQSNRARYDEIREAYRDKYGRYPEFDRDPIPDDIADDVDRAFDEIVDDADLPEDWMMHVEPDVAKVYKDDLPQVGFDWEEVHDDVYRILGEKMGIEGGADAIKRKLKNLYTFLHKDFRRECLPMWEEAAAASGAAQKKMQDVAERVDALRSMQRKLRGLDPASADATALEKLIARKRSECNGVAREAFDLVRSAFWRRANKRLESYMKDAGLDVGKGGKSAGIGGVDQPVSIEHGVGLEENPLRAIDGSHMMFSPNVENTKILRMRRNLIKQRFEELGYSGPHPWL